MGFSAFVAETEEHRQALVKLWRESLPSEHIAKVIDQRLDWLYQLNPAGKPQTWLVAPGQGEAIIGCGTMYPRELWVNGRMVRAGVLCDFAVAQEHRIAGPAVALQRAMARASLDAGFELLYGYPNDHALPIFKRLGYAVLGDATVWVKSLRTAYKLRDYLPSPLAKLASRLADPLLGAHDWRLLLRRPRGFRGQTHERATADFDELWARGKNGLPLVGERGQAYLSWRYGGPTTERVRFYGLHETSGGRLRGYLAYHVVDRKAFVLDAFWDGDMAVLETMLLRFSLELRQQGHDSVCIVHAGDPRVLECIQKLLFIKREGTRKLICFVDKRQPEAFRNMVLDGQRWSLFDGELDI